MNILINILYLVTLGVIRVRRMFLYFFYYIGFEQVKWYIRFRLNSAEIGDQYSSEPQGMIVHNELTYQRLACDGTLGLGESYIDEWWDCKKLDEFCTKGFLTGVFNELCSPLDRLSNYFEFRVHNMHVMNRTSELIAKHYDLGNELYKSFLDKSMIYSCAYWKDAKNLVEAQQHKMELIGRKLKLKPGMRVLDMGCGWGGLCKFLAETYNVEVVGVTISKEGAQEGQERCKGLPVEIRVQDYRDVSGIYDRIVAIGLLEHVGYKNYRSFFELANRCLSDDGILLVHTIGHDNDRIPTHDPFMNKYIFPTSNLADHKDIPVSIDNLFCIEDWHNFGPDYDKTLMAWHENFDKNWSTISYLFDEPKRFYRMWSFYLLACAAMFRSRRLQLWQIVMTKWVPGGYISVR